MPTYDYVCRHCEHAFEQFQSITAGPLRKCPACGKMRLKRLIGTGAGVIFKGSGFYETDYRSPSYEKQAKAEREGGGGDKAGSESGSETKAEGGGSESAAKHDGSAEREKTNTSERNSSTASGGDGGGSAT